MKRALLLAACGLAALAAAAPARAQQQPIERHAADDAAFRSEQAALAALAGSGDLEDRLQLAVRYGEGVLVAPGNPLRLPRTDEAIRILEALTATAGEAGERVRLELVRQLTARGEPGDLAAARQLAEGLVRGGSIRAGLQLAAMLEAGRGGAPDAARALTLYRDAFAAGEIRAIDGIIRLDAVAGPSLRARRLPLLASRAEESSWAATELAVAFSTGDGAPFDPRRALAFARIALRKGDVQAALKLHNAFLARPGLDPESVAGERDLLLGAVRAGSIEAARALARDFAQLGRFVLPQNDARQLFEHLVRAGDGRSMFLYAQLLREGVKFPPDAERADRAEDDLVVFARAHPAAAYRFAREMIAEDSAFRDRGLAQALLQVAVEAGLPNAARDLARLTLFSPGVTEPEAGKAALAALRTAADAGDMTASLLLIRALSEGRGQTSDPVAALSVADKLIKQTPVADAFLARGRLFLRYGGADQALAVADLERAAELGSGEAMATLGQMHLHGLVVPKDRSKAISWFESAVKAGRAEAFRILSGLLLQREPTDTAVQLRAVDLYQRGWQGGDAFAAIALGQLFVSKGNSAAARDVYAKLAQTDVPLGKAALGLLLAKDGSGNGGQLMMEAARAVDQRPRVLRFVAESMLSFPDPAIAKKGAALLAASASAGEAEAAETLALAYLRGKGVARDLDQAERFAQMATAGGRTDVYRDLGHALSVADGVPEDQPRARSIRERAAALEPDNAHARYDLARMLLDGDGGPRDIARGTAELIAAVRLGHLNAQIRLAAQIQNGDASLGSIEDAIALLEDAARRGSVEAAVMLGRLMSSGEAGFIDGDRAALWYGRAADAGSLEGKLELARRPLSLELGEKNEAEGLAALSALGTGEAEAERARYLFATAKGAETAPRSAAALTALRRAAELGEAEAMFQLSTLYERGELLPRDKATARAWLRRAAGAGHAFSRSLLTAPAAESDPQEP